MTRASHEARCPRCAAEVPAENQSLHELRCFAEQPRSEVGWIGNGDGVIPQTSAAREQPPMPPDGNAGTSRLSLDAPNFQINSFALTAAPRSAGTTVETISTLGESDTELQQQANGRTTSQGQPTNDGAWNCAACTFLNDSGRSRCEICLTYRAGAEPANTHPGQELVSEANSAQLLARRHLSRGFCTFCFGAFIGISMCTCMGFQDGLDASKAIIMNFVVGVIGGCIWWIGYRWATRRHSPESNARPLLASEELVERGQTTWQSPQASPRFISRARAEELDAALASRMRRLQRRQSQTHLRQSGNESAIRAEGRLDALLQLVAEHQQRLEVDRQTQAAPRGLIAALPTHTITAQQVASMLVENRSCTICIDDFQEGDEVRMLPCFHRFHKGCVDQWLRRSGTCPICKHRVDGAESTP